MNPLLKVAIYLGAILLATACALSPYRVGVVSGESMAPTYHTGGVYVMRKTSAREAVHAGDVVVFQREGRTFIKRILGVPGDTFYVLSRDRDISKDSLVREWEIPMLKLLAQAHWSGTHMAARTVPSGDLYVVGDNLEVSEDSRSFGFIPRESLMGKVVAAPVSPRAEFSDLARLPFRQL
jgi:signal peptidase I